MLSRVIYLVNKLVLDVHRVLEMVLGLDCPELDLLLLDLVWDLLDSHKIDLLHLQRPEEEQREEEVQLPPHLDRLLPSMVNNGHHLLQELLVLQDLPIRAMSRVDRRDLRALMLRRLKEKLASKKRRGM